LLRRAAAYYFNFSSAGIQTIQKNEHFKNTGTNLTLATHSLFSLFNQEGEDKVFCDLQKEINRRMFGFHGIKNR